MAFIVDKVESLGFGIKFRRRDSVWVQIGTFHDKYVMAIREGDIEPMVIYFMEEPKEDELI